MTARTIGLRTFALPAAILALAVLGTLGYVAMSRSSPSPPPDLPASPVEGVVVRIDQESLGEINEVDILMANGKTITLAVGSLENAPEFSPSHLTQHMATAEPIRAFYRLVDGRSVIYRLEDAAPSATPSAPPAT